MKVLNDMPSSDSKFWDGEVNLHPMGKRPSHEHSFEQVGSREIKCKCGMGLFIGLGDKVKEGHLYHYDRLVI